MMPPTTTWHADGAFLVARRRRVGFLQSDIAARLGGVRAEVVSSIETERAKHMATRDSYRAFSD